MKLAIPIEVDFDDMKTLLEDVKKLQTYKLSEDDDMVLVNINDIAEILVKHIQAKEAKMPHWIPCSDGLPEEDKYVLICLEDDPKEEYYCMMAVGWLEDGFWQCWDDRANTRKDVVAWMPLPEPYKGGEDHETD